MVPAAMAMLLEWCNGREQSSWASSSMAIKLGCHPHQPWHWPPIHSQFTHLAYIKAMLIIPRDHP